MSEYGCEITLVQAFNYDKERLLKALEGQLMCGEDENGFNYSDAPEEACREEIIKLFDNAVYLALQGYRSGRVMEKSAEANGVDIKSGQFFLDYLHFTTCDEAEQEEYNYGDPENTTFDE